MNTRKFFQFVDKNELKINIEFFDLLKRKGILDFESFWNLPNSFFYYQKRYRIIEAYNLGEIKLYIKKYKDNQKEAEEEWKNLLLLWKMGFPTLIPIVFGKKKNMAFVGTEELRAPSSLYLLTDKLIPPDIFLTKFSKFLAEMHDKNIFHRDCYLGHFHYDKNSDIFYIMDVARVKYNPFFKIKFLLKDLAQLKFSFLEIFNDSISYWWDFFWENYNQYKKKKLGKIMKILVDKKTSFISRHTQNVIKKGGEGVISYYKTPYE